MKPILIDALHICMGGGLMILNHLVSNMIKRKVDFILLKDTRCPELNDERNIPHVEVLSSDNKTRKDFYRKHRTDFSCILCFGNIPPQIKMPVPVHTYLHNVSLLKVPKDYSLKAKILSYLKKRFISHYAKYTDTWIVQTSNSENLVKKHLSKNNQPIFQYPFYHIPKNINRVPQQERTDYCFIGEYTNAKGHEYLVEAWLELAKRGITPTLHLTVSHTPLISQIIDANKIGAQIVNHGFVSFSEVIEIYNKSKCIIYPSLNESLGLGIVEGVEAGCDIIGANLPYLHAVCEPSDVFESCNVESIADAVTRYENESRTPSKMRIKDEIIPFISFITRFDK